MMQERALQAAIRIGAVRSEDALEQIVGERILAAGDEERARLAVGLLIVAALRDLTIAIDEGGSK